MRSAALSLVLLLLIASVVVCSHPVDPQHDKHCSICASARLQVDIPDAAPVLAALAASPDGIPEHSTPPPPAQRKPARPGRAPPQTLDSARLP